VRQTSVQNGKSLTRPEHRKHDRLLVTRFAMDDAYPSERTEAIELIRSCPECARLAQDIRQISNAVGQIPVPARTRDFAISAEKAQELRGSRLARWMRSFATPRWRTLRPVAGVALSIGLVMAVVGTAMPSTMPGTFESTSGAAQEFDNSGEQPPEAPQPTAEAAPAAPGQQPVANGAEDQPGALPSDPMEIYMQATEAPVSRDVNKAYTNASPVPGAGGDAEGLTLSAPRDSTSNLLVWSGLLIATISVGLLALAFVARRYFADPLLR
jgi:hypothetical protein